MSADGTDGTVETPTLPSPSVPKKKKPVKKSAPVKKAAPVAKAATKAPAKKEGKSGVNLKEVQLAAITLKMASDATRLQVISILSDGECHVGGLSEQLNQSQPAVSHHLALLRHGGIITPRRDGKNNFYSLTSRGEQLAAVAKALMND